MMLFSKHKNSTGLLTMLSDLWRNLKTLFKPYDLEDYIRDCDPKDSMELESRMRNWERYRRGMDFGNSY